MQPDRTLARQSFIARSGMAAARVDPLPGDASFRHYIRLWQDGQSHMLMDAPPPREDVRPFLAVARLLHQLGHSAPQVLAADEAEGFLLLEDLGNDLFARVLATAPERELELYTPAVTLLTTIAQQTAAANPGVPAYDDALMLREVSLFTEWYLPAILGKDAASELSASFAALWPPLFALARSVPSTLVLRDYHAENLIWLPNRHHTARVGLLDFQDAVYGPITYDLVSLLEDARRDTNPATCASLLDAFIAAFPCIPAHAIKASYALMGLQRNLKIIGIFTRLSVRDGKHHYLPLLNRVWAHVAHDLTHPACQPVADWLDAHLPASKRGVPKL